MRQTMARTAVTGSCLLLLTLRLLAAAAATPGKTNDREGRAPMWPFDRQPSTSAAHNQPVTDDNEGSEADYDDDDDASPWQRQHDARSNDEDDDDDDETSSKASYDVVDDKRKWSKNNVRIWGKRRWSSKGLNMWGKRRSNATAAAAAAAAEIVRGGAGGMNYGDAGMNDYRSVETVAGRNVDDKRKWAKNNLKIWGKRFLDKSSDQEEEIAKNPAVEGGKRRGQEEDYYYPIMRGTLLDRFPTFLHKRNSLSSVEQKYGKKGWSNNNVRIWG